MTELYKKHRPKSFRNIIGNESTVSSLKAMLVAKSLPHTCLFHGPSGCGKTTLARIVAQALGCGDMDFMEYNSSSFRGIDTVREIQRLMCLQPISGPVRIWLMDEVHKLSNDAQNAALKILEDTPTHVFFLLCTTNPEKLIKPLRNRCTEFPVQSLNRDGMTTLLSKVAAKEGVELQDDIVDEIVDSSQGSARLALVLLERISHLKPEDRIKAIQERVEQETEGIDLCRALIRKERWPKIQSILKSLKTDPEKVRWNVLGYARAVLLKETSHQAYLVIRCFSEPFHNTKDSGLIAACFEAIFDK